MRYLISILFAVCVSGCASGYQQFYKSYIDASTPADVQYLEEGKTPTIYSSNDLNRDEKNLISKGYHPIGRSAFNGVLEGEEKVSAQAIRVGAQVVLVKALYTDTQANLVPIRLPDATTTYVTTHHRLFDQEAVYFAKATKKLKYGVRLAELTPEIRATIQRNMGAVIDIVMENTAAFTANVIPGDILIQIDGVDVQNREHASQLMKDASPPDGVSQITVLRGGEKKIIAIRLEENKPR